MLPGHIEINFNPEAELVLNGEVAVFDDWSIVDDKVGDLKSDTFLPFLTGPKSVSLWAQGQRSKQYNFFFQDEWKMRRNLAMSVGVRWELNPPPTEVGGRV